MRAKTVWLLLGVLRALGRTQRLLGFDNASVRRSSPERLPHQVTLRKQQPVMARVLDQALKAPIGSVMDPCERSSGLAL